MDEVASARNQAYEARMEVHGIEYSMYLRTVGGIPAAKN